MSKGPGIQQAILKLIEGAPDGSWTIQELAGLVYSNSGDPPTRAQLSATAQALAGLALPGTWALRLADMDTSAKGETARELLAEHAKARVGSPAAVRAAIELSRIDGDSPKDGKAPATPVRGAPTPDYTRGSLDDLDVFYRLWRMFCRNEATEDPEGRQ